jgi:hypothetical protein
MLQNTSEPKVIVKVAPELKVGLVVEGFKMDLSVVKLCHVW